MVLKYWLKYVGNKRNNISVGIAQGKINFNIVFRFSVKNAYNIKDKHRMKYVSNCVAAMTKRTLVKNKYFLFVKDCVLSILRTIKKVIMLKEKAMRFL